MNEHLAIFPFDELIERNEKIVFSEENFSINQPRLTEKIRYWWSWTIAGFLLLFAALPAMIFLRH